MRYIRKHGQQNLIKDDSCDGTPDLIKNRLKPETFDNVKYFWIKTTQDSEFECREGDSLAITDIIEGHSHFTFVSMSKKSVTIIRYDWVMSFGFEEA